MNWDKIVKCSIQMQLWRFGFPNGKVENIFSYLVNSLSIGKYYMLGYKWKKLNTRSANVTGKKHTDINIFLQGSFWVSWTKSLNESQMFTVYLSYKTYLSQLTLYLAIKNREKVLQESNFNFRPCNKLLGCSSLYHLSNSVISLNSSNINVVSLLQPPFIAFLWYAIVWEAQEEQGCLNISPFIRQTHNLAG